jgi:hypothetical protein
MTDDKKHPRKQRRTRYRTSVLIDMLHTKIQLQLDVDTNAQLQSKQEIVTMLGAENLLRKPMQRIEMMR